MFSRLSRYRPVLTGLGLIVTNTTHQNGMTIKRTEISPRRRVSWSSPPNQWLLLGAGFLADLGIFKGFKGHLLKPRDRAVVNDIF